MTKSTAAQEPTCVRADSPIVRSSSGELRRRRVLIVDDEPLLLSLMVRVLEADYDVVDATGGRVALAAFQRGDRFD